MSTIDSCPKDLHHTGAFGFLRPGESALKSWYVYKLLLFTARFEGGVVKIVVVAVACIYRFEGLRVHYPWCLF